MKKCSSLLEEAVELNQSPARKIPSGTSATLHGVNELKREHASRRLDDAARAGWLYYVSGHTQDEIAQKLRVSRQTAQRLVSLSLSEGLIKVRLDHRIGRCMELAERLRLEFGLSYADVVPSDTNAQDGTIGLAQAMATEMELRLASEVPRVIAVGTGRMLKAAVEQLVPSEAPQHRIVSLAGNIAPDGSASYYNVIFSMADRVRARYFPLPLPVIASSAEERRQLQAQPMVRETLELAREAETAFVGIGQIGLDAPLVRDGFIGAADLKALSKVGAIGEIVGWVFGTGGQLVEGLTNDRVASAKLPDRDRCEVIAVAAGEAKLASLLGAIRGRLVSGLITNEATAELLIEHGTRQPLKRFAGQF
jgi:DNA-binding transcriptional regulator LsrR (DeoR family)